VLPIRAITIRRLLDEALAAAQAAHPATRTPLR
jgi:hypothetical protein